MFLPERSPGEEWIGVVIAIPEPWVSQLTEMRLGLGDLHGALVPAHITLLPPTPVPVEAREELILHLRSVAAGHQPFRLTLGGAGTFRPASPVAFLELAQGAEECVALADDVRTGPLDVPLRFPYHPHVTLAQDVDEVALDHAMALGEAFTASWTVPGFRLDRVDATGAYSSMAIFDFEGA